MTGLSIIIVNYKSPGLVLDCLRTVYAQTTNTVGFEVIVVDNASGDDSRERILDAFPSVRWIQMGYNAGFARANNEGIRGSRGDAVLLLNSDTLIEDRAIEECYQRLSSSDYVACGVQLLNPDRTPQISGNFFMKGGLNYLLPLPYLGDLVKKAGMFFNVSKPNVPDAIDLVEVDWINGAFLMVKKDAIEKAGLLDEDFFLYAEEAEWCSRLRKLGKLCIFGHLHVVHLQGASANETFGSEGKGYYNLYDRKGLQIMLSNFVRIRKQFGVGWFLLLLAFYVLEIPVFFIGVLLARIFRGGRSLFSFAQFLKYCKNIVFVTGKSVHIIRNKPYFYKVL
ncbi:MAG: glycosyltransferase family 2 protein [Chitinophagaceae bacterium]|nr:glycosyltransferase family 2 protein [Chitinophagaceae bacterium]